MNTVNCTLKLQVKIKLVVSITYMLLKTDYFIGFIVIKMKFKDNQSN